MIDACPFPCATQYPEYLKQNASTISAEDLERYKKQEEIVIQIVAKFDEPGADKDATAMSPAEEQRQKDRQGEVAELVAKMNDCGAPPKEIMGELPQGECECRLFSLHVI